MVWLGRVVPGRVVGSLMTIVLGSFPEKRATNKTNNFSKADSKLRHGLLELLRVGSGQIVMTSQDEQTGVRATLDELDLSRYEPDQVAPGLRPVFIWKACL